ncbi:hypothetical protein E3N88_00731 [Mikania micrantha]|uniref:Uncharacterized protein n=1 Tax=Mikania micrantha TaxID=192012 RepID=A0A5N6PYZ9_9ASTR|nr:hypothetical protein E3N88_00731 [Mikania micrantha]
MFTLTKSNGGIMVLDLFQLMIIAEPFVYDLEGLPLHNPDNGSDGRIASKWAKARAHIYSELFSLPKTNKEDILVKVSSKEDLSEAQKITKIKCLL